MRWFTLLGVCSINYKVFGTGDKLIVFLHGFGGGFESFAEVAQMLDDRYKCLLISFFESEPEKPLTIFDYYEYVSQVIKMQTANEIIVVGHSFGGRVAIKLAVNNCCDKLVLVDSAGLRPKRGIKYYIKVYTYKIKKKLKLNIEKYGSHDYKTLSPVMKQTFINIVNHYQNKEITKINIPTLIFWGSEDKETPLEFAKTFNKKIKDSRLVVIENCGHFSYLQSKDTFYNCLRSFCGK